MGRPEQSLAALLAVLPWAQAHIHKDPPWMWNLLSKMQSHPESRTGSELNMCVCAPSHERVYAHMSIWWIHNDHFLILQEFSGKASKMTEQMFIKHMLFKTDGLSSTPRTHVKPRGITWASVILALPQGDGWPGQENSLEVSEQWAWNTQCYSRHKRNACFKSRKKERTNSQKIDLRPLHTMNTYNIVMLVKK